MSKHHIMLVEFAWKAPSLLRSTQQIWTGRGWFMHLLSSAFSAWRLSSAPRKRRPPPHACMHAAPPVWRAASSRRLLAPRPAMKLGADDWSDSGSDSDDPVDRLETRSPTPSEKQQLLAAPLPARTEPVALKSANSNTDIEDLTQPTQVTLPA